MLKKLFNRKRSDTPVIDRNIIPQHVAIIMDGNGRWAKRRGMPRSMGHRAGADVLKEIVMAADEIGIRALTVYGFSTENWKRPEQEVSLLMSLIKEYLNNNVKYMHEHNVRIRFIGFIGGLSEDLQKIIQDAELLTQNNTGPVSYTHLDVYKRQQQDLCDAIIHANQRIVNRVACEERLAGMGTTAVVTAINGNQLYWASVGDSRLYVYRDCLLYTSYR